MWRWEMRRAALVPPDFVLTVAKPPPSLPEMAASLAGPPWAEVKLSGAVLHVAPDTDGELLTTVLRAIRASAA